MGAAGNTAWGHPSLNTPSQARGAQEPTSLLVITVPRARWPFTLKC